MANLDPGPLPPWLTRQYDYAAGFRGFGDAYLKGKQVGLQRDRVALEQQHLGLQAAQQRSIEAHRKVQEGIEQAQEARQAEIYAKRGSDELSRRLGMKMFNDGMEIFHGMHPDATPSETAQATTENMLKNAPNIFPDGQGFAQAVQHASQEMGRAGLQESLINMRESSANLSDVRAENIANTAWLGPGNTGAVKQFAGQPLTQLISAQAKAKEEGRDEDVARYETEIAQRQGKAPFAARSKAHSELSTTLRQQMRAIDADKDLKPAERDTRKAVLLRQLEESRRGLLGELEGEQTSVEEDATRSAVTKLEKEIADVRIDLVKNPKQGRTDFGEDNRKLKLKELIQQRDNLLQKPPPTTAPNPALEDARKAIKAGASREKVIERLRNMGITEEP